MAASGSEDSATWISKAICAATACEAMRGAIGKESTHLVLQEQLVCHELVVEQEEVVERGRDEVDKDGADRREDKERQELAVDVVLGPGGRVHVGREERAVEEVQDVVHRGAGAREHKVSIGWMCSSQSSRSTGRQEDGHVHARQHSCSVVGWEMRTTQRTQHRTRVAQQPSRMLLK
jgi:hypothetical protein